MSATDKLRRLLDERGVEWESKDVEGVSDFHDTRWNAYDVQWCYVEFVGNNYTKLKPSSEFHCTPEQAIAATLGNTRYERTCEIVEWYEARDVSEIGNNRVRFSCGHLGSSHDRYCVECGARVVKEEA